MRGDGDSALALTATTFAPLTLEIRWILVDWEEYGKAGSRFGTARERQQRPLRGVMGANGALVAAWDGPGRMPGKADPADVTPITPIPSPDSRKTPP